MNPLDNYIILLTAFSVEVWDVSVVTKKYGKGPMCPERREGYMEIDAHSEPIVHASFSPDGTALATVGLDSYIRFFQVGMTNIICNFGWFVFV